MYDKRYNIPINIGMYLYVSCLSLIKGYRSNKARHKESMLYTIQMDKDGNIVNRFIIPLIESGSLGHTTAMSFKELKAEVKAAKAEAEAAKAKLMKAKAEAEEAKAEAEEAKAEAEAAKAEAEAAKEAVKTTVEAAVEATKATTKATEAELSIENARLKALLQQYNIPYDK